MEQNGKVLCDLARASRMGADSTSHLLQKTEDQQLKSELQRQLDEYRIGEASAKKLLSQSGQKIRSQSSLVRASAWLGIEMETLTDRSASHLAEIMIQGETMGVIEITRSKAASPALKTEVSSLANAFLQKEQASIERLKAYL